jgi:crotonobetainyl-CoA:carnitine CoA-transferase CaiB-like acyl-CoA transferase
MNREDLITDARFGSPADRMANSGELMSIMDGIFAAKDFAEWKSILVSSKGVWAPAQSVEEMPDDVQVQANRMIRTVQYGDTSQPVVMPPVMFNEDAGPCNRAPDFSEHTDEVLRDVGGFDDETIAHLRAAGVVA